jgi:poly(hydroxyalkanoate) depolymerase family esterase
MDNGMMEATRLTREGKLAEAMALIQRTLGGGHGPTGPFTVQTVDPEPIETTFRIVGPEPASEGVPPVSGNVAQASIDAAAVPPITSGRPDKAAARVRRVPVSRRVARPSPMPPGGMPLPKMPAGWPGRGAARRLTPSATAAPEAGRWIEGTHTGESGTRAYKLYIPSGYCGEPVPLIVMLHGCTQNPDDFASGTRMNVLAEAGGFLVAYPEQAANSNASRCWNWFQPADQQRERGEPSLIAGITRQVMAEYTVDAGRVYVAGLSAGGAMAAIMGATYPDLYAAVGVHSGLAPGSAHDLPSAFQAMSQGGQARRSGAHRAIPLILFHGDRDSTVHPQNADQLVLQWANVAGLATNGDAPLHSGVLQGHSAGGQAYTRVIYRDVRGQTVAEQWTVHGAGHAWSGGSRAGSFTDPDGPDASSELVRFFREHPRGTTVPKPPVG